MSNSNDTATRLARVQHPLRARRQPAARITRQRGALQKRHVPFLGVNLDARIPLRPDKVVLRKARSPLLARTGLGTLQRLQECAPTDRSEDILETTSSVQ